MSPAHHIREPRWRILLVVAAVIVGVAVATGAKGAPTAPAAPARPSALVDAPNAESSAWYCTGQSTSTGDAPGFVVLTNTQSRPVNATVTTVTDDGASARTAVSVPALGPSRRRPSRRSRRGRGRPRRSASTGAVSRSSQAVQGSSGWDESPCQNTTSSRWYFSGETTTNGAGLFLSLLNPTATPVVADLTFMTPSGAVHPINYQGIVLQADSVVVENVASEVQNASTVSSVVTTRTGRASRPSSRCSQRLRRGSPWCPGSRPAVALDDPQAEEAANGSSAIDVFNPGAAPEKVVVHLRLASGPLAPLSSTVAPGSTWAIATSAQTRSPPALRTPPTWWRPVVQASSWVGASPCPPQRQHPRPARPSPWTARARHHREERGSFRRQGASPTLPSPGSRPTPWR